MNALIRLSLVAGGLAAIWVGINLVDSHRTEAVQGQDTEVASAWERVVGEQQRGEDLEGRLAAVDQVFREKRRILEDLAAERLTLREAVLRYQVLNQRRTPLMKEIVRNHLADWPEEEQPWREVVASLDALLVGDPCHLAAVRSHLVKQLEERRKANTLQLPAVATR